MITNTVVTVSYRIVQNQTYCSYGDGNSNGSFPSGGWGEQSVPAKAIKEAVKRQEYEVDEFRTSSVRPKCGDQLFKVV